MNSLHCISLGQVQININQVLLLLFVDRMERTNVSIITYGINTPVGKALHSRIFKQPDVFHEPMDVRQFMSRGSSHGNRYRVHGNADCKITQISLLDNPRFFDAVSHLVSKIELNDNSKIYTLHCSTGTSHSHGVAKAVCERVLNVALHGPTSGLRRFNAKVFSDNADHNNN